MIGLLLAMLQEEAYSDRTATSNVRGDRTATSNVGGGLQYRTATSNVGGGLQ